MRYFGGQVHVLELVAVLVACFFGYAIGYSLPLLAGLSLLIWPLLVLNLLLQGVFEVAWRGVRKLYRGLRPAKPEPPQAAAVPRVGAARYIWWLPLVFLTCGYGRYVFETGRWFL